MEQIVRVVIFVFLLAGLGLIGCAQREPAQTIQAASIPIVQERVTGVVVAKPAPAKKVRRAKKRRSYRRAATTRKSYANSAIRKKTAATSASQKAVEEANMRFMDEYLGAPPPEPPRLQ